MSPRPAAPRKRVLFVVHAHPSVLAGGAENYALQLYEQMREHPQFEPLLLARAGPPSFRQGLPHLGTPLIPAGEDPNQYLFYTDVADYDFFTSTLRTKSTYTEHYRAFLEAYRPEVVHFQHTIFLGFDMLVETRRTLPDAAIVYTLHEYLPICHNDGQMVRTDGSLCDSATPRRCHECFPSRSPQDFFLRERFIKSHLDLVDLFIAPSSFLMERYIAWGIPPERITCEENGRPATQALPESEEHRPRSRLGFFGQFSHFKGTDLAMEAMGLVGELQKASPGPEAHLWLHGTNLEYQTESFQEKFRQLLSQAGERVTLRGRYRPEELPELMSGIDWVVVPSRWWENSPLVIQEAFQHGRPVICSNIGGMAEKVTAGVNGLHFKVGDPYSLARTIVEAISTDSLWERLRQGIPRVHTLANHAENLTAIYRRLLRGGAVPRLANVGS